MDKIVKFPTQKKLPDYVEKVWLDEVSFFEERFNNTDFPMHLRHLFLKQYKDIFTNLVQMDIDVIVFDETNPSHSGFIKSQEKMIEQIFAYRAKVIEERRLLEMRLFINTYTGR